MRAEGGLSSVAHRDRDPCVLLDSTYPRGRDEFTGDKLCGDCSKVDFNVVTTRETERQEYIGMIATVWQNAWCPFCRIVKAAFREHVEGDVPWHNTLCRNNVNFRFFIRSNASRRVDDTNRNLYAYQIEICCVTKQGDTDIVNGISHLDVIPTNYSSDDAPKYSRRSINRHCDIELLRAWQGNCLRDHDHSERIPPLPQLLVTEHRVRGLDVDSLKLTPLGPDDAYCSLSYVCGDITQTALAARYCKGANTYVSFDALPQVLKDALWLTRKLGYRYLWYVIIHCSCQQTIFRVVWSSPCVQVNVIR